MLKETLKILFRRDLEKLRREIESYKDEKNLWKIEKEVSNSAGNLCLHLVGNLNTYIGAEIGKSGYVRNRDLEFSQKHISRNELLQKIDETIIAVENALETLTDEKFDEEYSLIVFDDPMTTGYFLVHLATHLNYHLGQINYHRRLLDDKE
jgi:uncharacterized damage-inducible protein DinB